MSAAVTPQAELDRTLLDEFQRDFPLVPHPYAAIATRLGTDEETVLAALETLSAEDCISRIGAIVAPHRAGWSTLAAMAVPANRLSEVAALVSGFPEVNHNYEREHRLNLWFVVTGEDRTHVVAVLDEIRNRTGLKVIDLPLLESFRLDLGFPLLWS
jgi:DNA-binding Lrp family transcriptional regulator